MRPRNGIIAFSFSPSNLLKALVYFTLFLIAADLAVLALKVITGHDVAKGLIPFFDLDSERNLPTLFVTGLWLMSAALAFDLGKNHTLTRPMRVGWWGLAVIFVYMGIDEFSVIHEHATRHVKDNVSGLDDVAFAWLLPYLLFAVGVGLVYLKFLFKLAPGPRYTILLAGMVFITGAAGFEIIAYSYKAYTGQSGGLVWGLLSTVEESLEMTGVLMLLAALFGLKAGYRPWLFRLFERERSATEARTRYTEAHSR